MTFSTLSGNHAPRKLGDSCLGGKWGDRYVLLYSKVLYSAKLLTFYWVHWISLLNIDRGAILFLGQPFGSRGVQIWSGLVNYPGISFLPEGDLCRFVIPDPQKTIYLKGFDDKPFLSRRQYPNRRELIWITKRTQKYKNSWLLHHFPIGKSRSPYVPIFSYKIPEFLIPAEQRKLKGHQRNTLWEPSQISIAILKLTWSCHRLRVGSELFGIPELFGQSFLVQLF